ncbi:MAG: hypothetical protein CVT92_09960 [Bacteroidetes bacterium HGW-Bacteroidetes-1]|jgi:agmatine/peptidylarginine deiminase|nr:MAG: hypothetical protein CVT92_09960 [Bacteroidetes bacterium HGW-Bacteroidetes-1]
MKKKYLLFLLPFILMHPFLFGQWTQDAKPDYRKLHYLSQEEMLTPVRTHVDFTETPPPPGQVRMVAEFEPAQAVLIRYQFGIPFSLIREMASDIQVITLVSSTSQANQVLGQYQNNNINTANCTFLIAPSDSYWTRDYGPWFIFDGNNQPGIVDFPYNRPRPNDNNVPPKVAEHLGISLYGMNVTHTGGNIMVDGLGIGSSTDLVYDESSQTPAQIAQKMSDYLGLSRYDVMEDPLGDYIKHIDCWGKYLAPDKILIGQVASNDPRYSDYEAVANYFASTPSSYGYPYKVYRVFTPGGNPATPYTNSLILNNKVFVPITGSQYDNAALAVYEQAMPGYQIVPIQYSSWVNTDALHCRTHEIADLEMLFVDHRPTYGTIEWQDSISISAKIIPYSGEELLSDSLLIHYAINGQPFETSPLSQSLGEIYTGFIKNYGSFDTIRYFLTSVDASGKRIKHPYMGALDPHIFILGEQTLTDITINPDTLYFINEFNASFVIKNSTANEVLINQMDVDFELATLPELPSFPYVLAPGDSLVVPVEVIPGVMTLNPDYVFIEAIVNIETNISTKNVTLLINEQLISQNQESSVAAVNIFPNPFTSEVSFSFGSSSNNELELLIFDTNGQLVYKYQNQTNNKVSNHIIWNGNNNGGQKVREGIYFYQIKMGKEVYTGKIVRM